MKMSEPITAVAFARSSLRSRMRSTPASVSSLPPVASSTVSPFATVDLHHEDAVLASSMTSLAFVG